MKRASLLLALNLWVAPSFGPETSQARISGRILDPDRRPVTNANVMIGGISGAPTAGSSEETFRAQQTDDDGQYQLGFQFTPKDRPVRCTIVAERRGYQRAQKEINFPSAGGTSNHCDLVLHPGLILAGIVRFNFFSEREMQRSPALKELSHLITVTETDFEQHVMTDKNGAFEIYVPAGRYRLRARFMTQNIELKDIAAGTTNLVLAPSPFVWTRESAAAAFEDFWQAMARHYSYFFLRGMDWAAARGAYRDQAAAATNATAFARTLQQMLTPLADLHIWIDTPDGRLHTHRASYRYNGNRAAVSNTLEQITRCGTFALTGRTRAHGFGYFLMLRQSSADAESVKIALQGMEKLAEAPGFIVDLRQANGGSEPLAAEIAQFFCPRATVYAKHKYRNGPGPSDFTAPSDRILPASEMPYTRPVICLIGPGAVSSGEGFVKMMKALPHVTTVGMPTRGASGNPKPFRVGETGVTVTFSRWVDLLPNGETFEGRGIPPEVVVDEPVEAYRDADPTLAKALQLLDQKIAAQ